MSADLLISELVREFLTVFLGNNMPQMREWMQTFYPSIASLFGNSECHSLHGGTDGIILVLARLSAAGGLLECKESEEQSSRFDNVVFQWRDQGQDLCLFLRRRLNMV